MKKISIIIPIYNMEKHLSKCIDSILKQTYSDFELILVNDGSTDSSLKICNDYEKKDNRVIVIDKKNGGVSSARNAGLDAARGEYIGFVDPDDFISSEMYEILYNDIVTTSSDIAVCGHQDLKENGTLLFSTANDEKVVINPTECLKEILDEKLYLGTCWNKLYDKRLFEGERFNEGMPIAEDLDILVRVIPKCKKVVYNSKPLYFWINHDNSTIHQDFIKNKKKWDGEIELCKRIIEYMHDNNEELLDYAIKRYVRINFSCLAKIVLNKYDFNFVKQYKDNILKYYSDCMKYDFISFGFKLKLFLIKINPRLLLLFNYFYVLIKHRSMI